MPTEPLKEDYKPIPIEAARALAIQYEKSVVIIAAHDPKHGLLHITTFGGTPDEKDWAAHGGEIVAHALGCELEKSVSYGDYRLDQAKKLLAALKHSITVMEAASQGKKMKRNVDSMQGVVDEAEKFLGR